MPGGVLESLIQPAGAGSQIPGEFLVPETAFPRVDSLINLPAVARQLPRGVTLRWASAPTSVGVQSVRFLYALEERPIITGSNLEDATAQLDPLTNGPIVTFQLDRAGGRKFGDETGKHVGDYMAILLDGRVQGRPPVIQSRIGRNGQITLGNKSLQEAQDLALTLKAGALPIPLKIVEERQVGASLGSDSIREGHHRRSGRHAARDPDHGGVLPAERRARRASRSALYILFTLGGLSMVDATLTLPGLAGIVLSIGIAVDANVLIFERIREELQLGKTVRLRDRRGIQARHERHRRLQRLHGHHGAVPLPVRHRAGQGLRGDPDHGHHRLDDHGGLRHPHLLHDLARPPAGHVHPEHLTMTRLFAQRQLRFHRRPAVRLRHHRRLPPSRACSSS